MSVIKKIQLPDGTQLDVGVDDTTLVHKTGNETIAGTKTFSSTISGNISGSSASCTGNAATATKAAQDSSGNQINSSYMPLKYSRYSIVTYSSSNPYIKLATFTRSSNSNEDTSCLFWVEALSVGTTKSYALVRLSARWNVSSYEDTKLEILERYGDDTSVFDSLVWAYKYTTTSSNNTLIGELWLKTEELNWRTYYFRPTQCNEYGDYSCIPIKMDSNPWTYYEKHGNSTDIASTSITSGYTQVKVTDKSIRYHEPLLSCRWSDHLLNDVSWLRADTFSWQSGDVYKTVYDKLVAEYDNSTSTTVTKDGITYKISPNGFKIAAADQETNISNKYNLNGVAWYYIIDTTNKRFKLPRTKFGFEGLRSNVGDDIAESLPNITGVSSVGSGTGSGGLVSGAFYYDGTISGEGGGTGGIDDKVRFDASRCSNAYQDNAPVQERATQMYLYFYVGEYAQSAIAQTAGLNSELFNGKADITAVTPKQYCIQNKEETTTTIEAPYLKTAYVNGISGYNIWSNGYCEQWGQTVCARAGTTIPLAKTFKDTNYLVTSGVIFNSQSNYASLTVGNKETRSFTGYHYDAKTVTWKACGYLAEGQY